MSLKTDEEFQARYEIDDFWRDAWWKLGRRNDPDRLQDTQDYIERRGNIANHRIYKLMCEFDVVNSTRGEG